MLWFRSPPLTPTPTPHPPPQPIPEYITKEASNLMQKTEKGCLDALTHEGFVCFNHPDRLTSFGEAASDELGTAVLTAPDGLVTATFQQVVYDKKNNPKTLYQGGQRKQLDTPTIRRAGADKYPQFQPTIQFVDRVLKELPKWLIGTGEEIMRDSILVNDKPTGSYQRAPQCLHVDFPTPSRGTRVVVVACARCSIVVVPYSHHAVLMAGSRFKESDSDADENTASIMPPMAPWKIILEPRQAVAFHAYTVHGGDMALEEGKPGPRIHAYIGEVKPAEVPDADHQRVSDRGGSTQPASHLIGCNPTPFMHARFLQAIGLYSLPPPS